MAATGVLCGSTVVAGTDVQRSEEVLDAGAYRYAYIEFLLEKLDGSPTTGSMTVEIETASENISYRYKQAKNLSDSGISFTVNYNSTATTVSVQVSDRFGRFLRWRVSAFTIDASTKVTFSIRTVLKDS